MLGKSESSWKLTEWLGSNLVAAQKESIV